MRYLLKFSRDWADEFQCEQFKIVETLEEAESLVEKIETSEGELSFGTNEYFEPEELLDSVDIKEISDEDALVITSLLGDSFGTGILNCFRWD